MMMTAAADRSNRLAPGFRFHPTDEELVSYYLRRKVSGLPLRADAITEVDLYKREPWDLPSLSRLRTRDMEWYFFSPLDRKYSNRSRTNRGTGEGYWKTTGKDRQVRRGSRVVGMKKTLVYHLGRAPRGKRTNWVMHEYRLEEADPPAAASASSSTAPALALALPQDAFVVCRIFQKSGSGPQNGAQYGAPFIEEEWDEDDNLPLVKSGGASDILTCDTENKDVHSEDSEREKPLVSQPEGPTLTKEESGGQDGESHADDPTLLDNLLNLETLVEVSDDSRNNTENTMENHFKEDRSSSSPDQSEDFLELKDIYGTVNGLCNVYSSGELPQMQNHAIVENGVYAATTWSPVDGNEFIFDFSNDAVSAQELNHMCLPADGVFDMPPIDFHNQVMEDYSSGRQIEDNCVFYDAAHAHDPQYSEDISLNKNDIQFSPDADFDDIMAFLDATDSSLQHDFLDSAEETELFVNSAIITPSNPVLEVEDGSFIPGKPIVNVTGTSAGKSLSSLASVNGPTNLLGSVNEVTPVLPDAEVNGGWNMALRKRAMGFLSSISAPPALAEGSIKGKVDSLLAAKDLSSPVHVSANLIHLRGMLETGGSEQWTLQKNGGAGIMSHGTAGGDPVGKSISYKPVPKLQGGGAFKKLLSVGFSLFGLSVLVLSASLKMGMCINSK